MIFNSSVDFEAISQPKYRNNKKKTAHMSEMRWNITQIRSCYH